MKCPTCGGGSSGRDGGRIAVNSAELLAERDRIRQAAEELIDVLEGGGYTIPAQQFYALTEALSVNAA